LAFPNSEIEALLTLNRLTSGHPQMGNWILQAASGALQFMAEFPFNQTEQSANIPPKVAAKILQARNGAAGELRRRVELDLLWLEASNHALISIFDEAYPYLLKQIHDPPLCLYLNGSKTMINSDQIAIVGSRKPTALGLKVAAKFAADLSDQGLVVTSGLAFGIDAAAHTGALNRSGKTLAVLGTGCDLIYPRHHERLALRILERGLIISEYPLGTGAFPSNFPQRNRIVTGLTMGTLIVEAALRSGSLISARLAMEQSREVFAVPGSIYSLQSAGCHRLIKDGAKLTQSVEDIVEELPGYVFKQKQQQENQLLSEQVTKYQDILQHLGASPLSADELFELTSIPISDILVALVQLELNGFILSSQHGYVLSH